MTTTRSRPVAVFCLVLLLLAKSSVDAQSGNSSPVIGRIGNNIVASDNSQDSAGVVFLINTAIPYAGTIFAFSAYLRSASPLTIQLWRPRLSVNSSTSDPVSFILVDELNYYPNVSALGQDDFYVKDLNRSCIRAQSQDRIGIYNSNDQPSWTYKFDTTSFSVRTYKAQGPLQIGDTADFDVLQFPYTIALAAYILYDNVQSNDNTSTVAENGTSEVQCPNVLIPSMTTILTTSTTTLPPTGAPGDTGVTGHVGSTGEVGPVGNVGAVGPIGSTGSTGATGSMGAVGAIGATGGQGETGWTGATGASGAQGIVGFTGEQGVTGEVGPQGETGPPATPPSTTLSTMSAIPDTGASTEQRWWRAESLIKGLYAWLAILSFLILIVLVWSLVLCCLFSALRRKAKQTDSDLRAHKYINAYPIQ